jgi:hypothetical protein
MAKPLTQSYLQSKESHRLYHKGLETLYSRGQNWTAILRDKSTGRLTHKNTLSRGFVGLGQ